MRSFCHWICFHLKLFILQYLYLFMLSFQLQAKELKRWHEIQWYSLFQIYILLFGKFSTLCVLRRVYAKKYPNFLREQRGLTAMFLYKCGFRKYRLSCYFPSFFVCVNTALGYGEGCKLWAWRDIARHYWNVIDKSDKLDTWCNKIENINVGYFIFPIICYVRTSEPSDRWTFGQMNLRTGEPSDRWTFGQMTWNRFHIVLATNDKDLPVSHVYCFHHDTRDCSFTLVWELK